MGNFFRFKWGEGGDGLETPSQTTTVDGTVSEQEGFGERYSLLYDPSNPELSNPNAIPLHRKLMNAIFNKITGAIQQYQKVGVPDFITSTDNNGVAFPYTVGAVCLLNGIQYRSLVTNNTTTPPSSSWEKVAPSVLDSTNTLISSPSVVKNEFFTGVVTGKWLTIKIAGLATATAGGVLDFGGMTVKIMQDDRYTNGVTIPNSWIVFIKGDMKNGVWENAQAINLGTDSTLTLPVSFTRTATDAFVEFDFTTIGTSYMSVIVQDVSTYIIGSYSPVISITMQSSKLGTLGTDATRSIVGNASLVDLAGKQPLNSILTGVTSNRLPLETYPGDLNTINIGSGGVKFFKITNTTTNTPTAANAGDYLVHFDYDGSEISLFQEYFTYLSARRFWRSKTNSGWSAWKEYQPVNDILTDFVNSQKLPVVFYANADANNIARSCIAVIDANVANTPANPQFILTYYWSSVNIQQTCYTLEDGGIWTRRNVGAGWTTWIKIRVEKTITTTTITTISLAVNTFRLVTKETAVYVDATSTGDYIYLLATIQMGSSSYVITVATSSTSLRAVGNFIVPSGAYYKITFIGNGSYPFVIKEIA